ncbi:hypothetical protein C7N43_25050 [Sphingobacteriales bacterium UPWRP_1]|nr:hypothetical protein BVG80_17170 [Sphingobacteriales bacterium TSM_CSM]PSJ74229.1 hypothetical protein C7N43_25050 [Sphingobacteriales bacterium UPWRP_1]
MSNTVFYTLIFMYLLFAAVFIAYYLLGPAKKNQYLQHKDFLLGTWQRKGISLANQPWQIEYTFSPAGTFEVNANPPLHLKGNYQVVSELENLLVVEFYNIEFTRGNHFYRHPQHLQLSVDKRDNQLTIDNRTYRRLTTDAIAQTAGNV